MIKLSTFVRGIICNDWRRFLLPGINGRIEYSITSGDDNEDFQILSNGTIRTRRALDRESKSSYSLIVSARDCAKEPEKQLSSTVQVSVCGMIALRWNKINFEFF